MEEDSVLFLGRSFLFPKELREYVSYCRKFQMDRNTLMDLIYDRSKKQWYDYPDKVFENILREICKHTIIILSEDNIYNVTVDDLLLQNQGYLEFLKITKESFGKYKEFSIREVQEYQREYESAYYEAASQITGSGLALISNSIVSHMTFAAMESYTVSRQARKAEKEFQMSMSAVANRTRLTKQQQESKYLYEVVYPAYIGIVEIFISELIDKYLSILEQNGIYDYAKIKNFDIDRSTELLNNVDLVENKTQCIIEAFKNCPYNINVYLKVWDMGWMDADTKATLAYFGQKEFFAGVLKSRLDDTFSVPQIDINKTRQEIKAIADFCEISEKELEHEVFSETLEIIDKNIKDVSEYMIDCYDRRRLIVKLGNGEVSVSKDEVDANISEKIITNVITRYEQIFGNDFLKDIFKKYHIDADSLDSFKGQIVKSIRDELNDQYKEKKENEEKIKKQNKKYCIELIIGFSIVIILGVIFMYLRSKNLYEEGVELENKGEYQLAAERFTHTNYFDAKDRLIDVSLKLYMKNREQLLNTIFHPSNDSGYYFAEKISHYISCLGQNYNVLEENSLIDFERFTEIDEGIYRGECEGSDYYSPEEVELIFNAHSNQLETIKFILEYDSWSEDDLNEFVGQPYDWGGYSSYTWYLDNEIFSEMEFDPDEYDQEYFSFSTRDELMFYL